MADAERRLRAAQDALASVPTEAPADAMLDFANALEEAIRGLVDKTGTMGQVNQGLRELFSAFRIEEREEAELGYVIDRCERRSRGSAVLAGASRRGPRGRAAADLKRTVIRIQPFLGADGRAGATARSRQPVR